MNTPTYKLQGTRHLVTPNFAGKSGAGCKSLPRLRQGLLPAGRQVGGQVSSLPFAKHL